MPFGLKNVPLEFQKIMNDIFTPHTKFIITYIDDILIFSNSIEQYFKHLQIFENEVTKNDLVISESKIELFKTKIRFLGYEISLRTTKPIQKSIEFVDKFPNQMLSKTQLQRFLESFSYAANYYKDLKIITKPLYDRLKKSHPHGWINKLKLLK